MSVAEPKSALVHGGPGVSETANRMSESACAPDDLEVLLYLRAIEDMSLRSQCCGPSLGPGWASYFYGPADGAWRLVSPAGRGFALDEASVSPSLRPLASGAFVLPRMRVINPMQPTFIADVYVDRGRIADLRAPQEQHPAEFSVLEQCADRFLLPGLVDMHAHLAGDNILRLGPHFLRLFLQHGVTTIREAGDADGSALPAARTLLARHPTMGPRIVASYYFVGRPPFRWRNVLAYRQPSDAPSIIERLQQVGAGCIKLYENLLAEDLRVLQDAAAKAGIRALGHVPTPLTLEQASIADAQHFFGVAPPHSLRRDHVVSRTADWQAVDERRMQEVVNHCARHGLANTPTLVTTKGLLRYRDYENASALCGTLMPSYFGEVVWNPEIGIPAYRHLGEQDLSNLQDAAPKKMRLVRELYESGAQLFPGSDTMQPFSIPGWALHRELELFVEAGIPASVALRMATRDAAQWLGLNDIGHISKDARADLLVFERDPAQDIRHLDSLTQVIKDGVVQGVADLQAATRQELQRREKAFARVSAYVLARLALRRAARHFVG